MAHAWASRSGQRPTQQPVDDADRRPRGRARARSTQAVDAARMRQLAGRRARRRARDRQVAARAGAPDARALGFQQLEAAAEHYSTSRAVLRPCAPSCASSSASLPIARPREEAGAHARSRSSAADARPRPVAAAARDSVRRRGAATPEASTRSTRQPAATSCTGAVETFLERMLMMPTLLVVEDAPLARRRLAVPPARTSSRGPRAALARLRDRRRPGARADRVRPAHGHADRAASR